MSGELVPYQLRHNKAVDRFAFLELLSRVHREKPMSDYTYVGFGGPFLEDFKIIHTQLGIRRLISIEQNPVVVARQNFNKPHDCIETLQSTSGDYITTFNHPGRVIIWLDYAAPNELGVQLGEFQTLLTKLTEYDVVKVTLCANANHVAKTVPEELLEDLLKRRMQALDSFAPGFGSTVTKEMLKSETYPLALLQMLNYAANAGLAGRPNLCFQPLASFAYADGAPMFTLTGVVLSQLERKRFLISTTLESWDLGSTSWNEFRRIEVPNLSIRERLMIDACLPNMSPEEVQKQLGFFVAGGADASLRAIRNYSIYYRHFPYFSRVAV